jgi:hypothetical protein
MRPRCDSLDAVRGITTGLGLALVALVSFAALFACGTTASQDPGLVTGDDGGGGVELDFDASGGLPCSSADSLASVCCGSGEPPTTACAATWESEQLCVGGGSFTQTLFTEPCDGLVASNDDYGGGAILIFDATSGQPVAIVKNNNPGLGLCVGAIDKSFVVPAACLTKWETPGTPACTPKPSSSFVTLCSSLSLPPQGCFVSAGSPPCALPTQCVFPADGTCSLDGVCLVPPASCQTTSTACGCVSGGSFTVCDDHAPQPVSPCDAGG